MKAQAYLIVSLVAFGALTCYAKKSIFIPEEKQITITNGTNGDIYININDIYLPKLKPHESYTSAGISARANWQIVITAVDKGIVKYNMAAREKALNNARGNPNNIITEAQNVHQKIRALGVNWKVVAQANGKLSLERGK